jgi:hypothetical protein
LKWLGSNLLNKAAASPSSKQAAMANEYGIAMCEKCTELDSKIEHYRFMASRITDQPMLDGIKELIERMQAQKLALHPKQAK